MSLAPFFFAWVYEDQTTFDPATMNVVDEDIYDMEIKHDEGQIPSLDLTIRNPRVGLLAPGRKVWAWLSYQPPTAEAVAAINELYGLESGNAYVFPCIIPLFFGVLVGIPTSLFAELITLKFIARSHTYIEDKQAVAETMKIRPFYDPIWLDDRHRDDPDSILEGWPRLWHVDRTTLVTTASDIITGEDGVVTFTEDDGFYEGVEFTLDQAPLSIVEVEATVNWTQRTIGYVDMNPPDFLSYTGQSLISEWPKPGSNLGSGWSVEESAAIDNFGIELGSTFTASSSSHWHNEDPERQQCDIDSTTVSWSLPVVSGISAWREHAAQTGICDPTAIPPTNIGASASSTGLVVPLWSISTELVLRYDANRKRSEKLFFSMSADTQAVLTSPTVQQNTDLITISSQDVGEPLLDVLAWTDFINKPVGFGQVIFPNNPTTPGGLSYQICIVPGIAGSVEPIFSDIVGQVTADNTAVWASLGTQPLLSQPGWASESPVPAGEIINPPAYTPLTWQELVNPDFNPNLIEGAQVSLGQVIKTNDGGWAMAIQGGSTGLNDPNVSSVYGTVTVDDLAQENLAAVLSRLNLANEGQLISYVLQNARNNTPGTTPGSQDAVIWQGIGRGSDGATFYLCTRPGTTQYLVPPNYNTPAGSVISDGPAVQWTSLGTAPSLLGIPIGGTAQDVKADNYFPSDRGLWSVEHLICLARVRLLLRSRAAKVAWNCPFDLAIGLSCRLNATIYEPRLPGGVATGKIISYSLKADGDGKLSAHVEIGCAVGFGNSIAEITGTPEYTGADDYMQLGYQLFDESVAVIASGDIGYTPPVYAPADDGLTFPLTKAQAVYHEEVHNTAANQIEPITAGIGVTLSSAVIGQRLLSSTQAETISLGSLPFFSIFGVQSAIEENAVWYELDLKPVVNGPFEAAYAITVTQLVVPQGINLLAPSSP